MDAKQILEQAKTLEFWDKVQLLNDLNKHLGFHYGALIDEADVRREIETRVENGEWTGRHFTDNQLYNVCEKFASTFVTTQEFKDMIDDIVDSIESL
jgi:hypothetical protein